jgi:single-stranded-DNA-specific exonuclease
MTSSVEELSGRMPPGLWESAKAAAGALSRSRKVIIATHIDADGISAGAIASKALERRGVSSEVRFFKKLDDEAIESLSNGDCDTVWLTDLGSGSVSKLGALPTVVSDHHVPDPCASSGSTTGQARLWDFSEVLHVNPQLHGVSGANDLSGAGATFLVAAAMDEGNADLAQLAVLGGVGDLQDQRTRRLEGLNRDIAALAVSAGVVDILQDIRLFGRETRPVHKMLEYSSDPFLPGITSDEQAAISFLLSLGVEPKDGDAWKTWAMLSQEEKDVIIDALRDLLKKRSRRPESILRLTGEVYALKKEARGSPLRDAKEFATLLNACGRHGKGDIGLAICMGDRGERLREGMALLRDHRSALSQAISLAKEIGVTRLRNIQYFDAGADIEDTIVGTVAGMLLGEAGSDRSAPMVAFADSMEYSDEPKAKASARGTQDLVSRGMDLSVAMRRAAEAVGGVGGGHNIAAGATIPASRKDDFLEQLDRLVEEQLTSRARPRG